jgi:hypothetical protein
MTCVNNSEGENMKLSKYEILNNLNLNDFHDA